MKQLELSTKCFISQPTEKKYIVIHGSNTRTHYSPIGGKVECARDVVARWNGNREKFACAYLIDRDGTVTQTFDDTYWSYHLNINNSHGAYDKTSIGVELINEGPLIKEGKDYFINKYVQHQNLYTGSLEYHPFRGFDYYACTSRDQDAALIDLIKILSAKHNVQPVWHNSYFFDKDIWDKASIFTHSVVNARVTDIPLWDELRCKLTSEFAGD